MVKVAVLVVHKISFVSFTEVELIRFLAVHHAYFVVRFYVILAPVSVYFNSVAKIHWFTHVTFSSSGNLVSTSSVNSLVHFIHYISSFCSQF